jgi:mono/diheme cytochrome c family protein
MEMTASIIRRQGDLMGKFILGLLPGIILLPGVLLLICATGNFPVAATAHPSHWETKLAQFVLARAMARQAPVLKNPLEARKENLLAGMKIFHDVCDGCHGTANQRSTWGTTGFYPRVPQFGFEPPTLPDWQIFWIAKNGIRYTGMAGYYPDMSDDNAWKVALFLSRLNSLPPDIAVKWHQKNP